MTQNGTIEKKAPSDLGQIMVNGQPLDQFVDDIQQKLTVQSALISRQGLASALGKQFEGDRDIYKAAGYPTNVTFDAYNAKFRRQDIAKRIVSAPAIDTWKNAPEVDDGSDGQSDFMQAWHDLASLQLVTNELDNLDGDQDIWHSLERADVLAGIGEYGGLLVGLADGAKGLDQEIVKGGAKPTAGLLYLTPLDKKQLTVKNTVKDQTQKRHGKVDQYSVNLGGETGSVAVHWSRVVHIAENLRDDLIHGTPRLEAVFNLLEDLLKITAGSSEAAWKLVYKGVILSAKDGYEVADDGISKEKAEEYVHGLMRVLEVDGYNVTIEGGEIVDPSPLIKILIALISAAVSIPQRILLGSERGELSSSQDERQYRSMIEARQARFAETVILRPLINRLIYAGVLPMPENNRYMIVWPNIASPTEAEQIEINAKKAEIIAKLSPAGAVDTVIDVGGIAELAQLDTLGQPIDDLLDQEDNDGIDDLDLDLPVGDQDLEGAAA